MDIPELSMAMASSRLSQNISYALMAKVLDTAEMAGEELIEMLEAPVVATPGLGENIDIVV